MSSREVSKASVWSLKDSLEFLKKLFRTDDWLSSVLPLVYSLLLSYALFEMDPAALELVDAVKFISFFVFVFTFLSFGYMINDYSDIEVDKACGKVKVIASMHTAAIRFVLCVLIVLGTIPMLLLAGNPCSMFCLLVLTYVLGAIYSISFIRAKERGVLGAIVSSFAQRGMLMIVAAYLFDMNFYHTITWVVFSFLDGLRYILIHQLIDYKNDTVSGVHTLATQTGQKPLRQAIVITLSFEAALLVPLVVAPCFVLHPKVSLAIWIVYAILSALLYLVHCRVLSERNLLFTFNCVPLETFVNFVVPATFSVYLGFENPFFFAATTILAIISWGSLRDKLKPLHFVPHLIRNVRFYE